MNLTDVLLELRAQSDDGGHHQTCIPTGSSDLNMILGGTSQGIPRKTVTVISGPPGTGKTAIALDLTAHTLTTGQRAVWLTTNDMALPVSRLTSHALYEDCTLRLLTHIAISSLSQVLMLFKTPPYYMPPRHTGLVIVDDLSSLVSDAYTLSSSSSLTIKKGNYSNEKKILEMANRRARALRNVLRAMKSFAETYNVAVVVLGGVVAQHSFMKGTQVLVPALGDGDWNKFVAGNIVLYKDIIQEEKYDEKYPYEKDDDNDNDKKEQEEEMVGYNTWYRQLKKENQKSTTTTTIELPVCHAARISHFNDLDPAILHQQGVALFDITSQGIRNFLPSSTFSSQKYMMKKKRQQSIEPIDKELVVKKLKSDEEKEEKEEDVEKSNQLKMNNDNNKNNNNNDNDDIIDDDDFNRVSEISATDSSPETLKPI